MIAKFILVQETPISEKLFHLPLNIVIKSMQGEDQKHLVLQKLVIPSENVYLT